MKIQILDTLCPERCVLCGQWIQGESRTGDYPLCRACKTLFRWTVEQRCRVCSLELTSEVEICMECRGRSFSFEQNVSLFPYRAHVQEAILAYKSHGVQRLSLFFAELLLPVWEKTFPQLPLLPVPPRPEGLKVRGFDPIGLICRELSRMGPVRVVPLLGRSKGTKEQKLLSKQQREENLRKAFFVKQEVLKRFFPEGKVPRSMVLLDDVFTTGATLHRCAEVLKEEGVQEVYGLTLARD